MRRVKRKTVGTGAPRKTKVSRVSRGDGCGAALTDAGLVCNAVEEWGEKDGVLLEKQPKEGELLEEQSEVEEEEGGDEEEEKGDTGRGVGTDEGKKKRKGGLYSLPTHDELQQIRETENLFHSNLMRLQITELLSEVKPKCDSPARHKMDSFLHRLRETLMALPATSKVDLSSALSLLPKGVCYPLTLDLSHTKGKFVFQPPPVVKVVGSYLLGTGTRAQMSVDIALQLPPDCLQAKDHLNYRYFHKRALYLCLVAGHCRKRCRDLGLASTQFTLFGGNPLLPILVLKLADKALSKYTVHLHTSAPTDYFKLTKLAPDRNNVRRNTLPDFTPKSADLRRVTKKEEEEGPACPTPHYNAALVLEQGGAERHLRLLYAVLQECPSVGDAVLLCRVWARQRGLDQGYGSFTGFHFAMLMALLLQRKKVNRLMSSYQLLRVALQFVACTDLTSNGVSMHQEDSAAAHVPPLSSFHSSFPVVFIDSSGYLNLTANMAADQFAHLQHEALLSLAHLDATGDGGGFDAMFMRPVPLVQKFDALCHISPASAFFSSDLTTDEAIRLDGAAWPLPHILRKLLPVLKKGLGKRVLLLCVEPRPTQQWSVSEAPPILSEGQVTLGLLLDSDHAFSILDMGPPADSAEAAQFRSFWGERSELRRFQDGSINEAVLWQGRSVCERKTVCLQVMQHLLHRHGGVAPECVSCTITALDGLLSLASYCQRSTGQLSTGEEVCSGVQDAFSELAKELRQLSDLPLSISSLQGSSPSFRHTEVFPPCSWNGKFATKFQATPTEECQSDCFYPSCEVATPPFVPALEVVCQLESSGKWPDDLAAIARIKTAFYLYIAKALKKEKGILSSPTPGFLDVLKSGYVFRLRLHYHREVVLMRDAVATTTLPRAAKALKDSVGEMEYSLVTLPLLTSTLHGLQQQYPAYGGGARLARRWVSSHLFSNHLSQEATDLMVASVLLSPAPFTVPSSPVSALLRFLSLLATFDWAAKPLVVNYNKQLSATAINDLSLRFTSRRAQLPVMVIATPNCTDSSPWTSHAPCLPVMTRLQLLARESLSLLSSRLRCDHGALCEEDLKQAFRTPLKDFNVLIHLYKKHVPLWRQAIDSPAPASTPSHSHRIAHTHLPVVDFNPPLKYLRELEEAYAEFALFFYDQCGGTVIAVVWKPQAFLPQRFKLAMAQTGGRHQDDVTMPIQVMQAGGRIPQPQSTLKHTEKQSLVPDVEAIISDFKLMGEGLVKSVKVLQDLPTSSPS